tara:strand:- start:2967 stop:4094 length:1128 start_codon:yes stop_codon:yes gene_type:complete
MIGGIFNVLGQAQQQAQAQQQKNMDAQNEMNRIMAMAGYKQNEADPAATQGGAGFMSSLKNTFGSTPYEFDPSQYAFDPNSPQGQQLELQRKEHEAIKKYYEDQIGLREQEADLNRNRFNEQKIQNAFSRSQTLRKFSADRYDALRNASFRDRELAFREAQARVEADLKRQDIGIAHMNATANGYKFINDDGQFITIDILNKDKDGNPTMTVKSLPSTATEKQVNALTQVRTLAQLKSTPTFWNELTDDQQDQFNDLITITMDFIVSGEDIWDDDDDEKVDETTEDPLVGGPVDLSTTSEDGGTGEVTSSATRARGSLSEDEKVLLEKISTGMATGDKNGNEELPAFGRDFLIALKELVERGVRGDKTPLLGGGN